MKIRFLLPTGRIVDSPYDFRDYQTKQNFPFYSRIKLYEIHDEFPRVIKKIRNKFKLTPTNALKTVLLPLIKEMEQDDVVKYYYREHLTQNLRQQIGLDFNDIENEFKSEFPYIPYYKILDDMPYPEALIELIVFGVTRVVPCKPLIDITREFKDEKGSIHIHIRNKVTKADLKEFIDEKYPLIENFFEKGTRIMPKDKLHISKRDLKILELKQKKMTSPKIADQLGIAGEGDTLTRMVYKRLKTLAHK